MAINTGIGLGVGIPFKRTKLVEKPYIEPDVLASLCGVWIADQNTNESPTRDTIKNKLKDRGGDFEILNAAYKLNSGYGLYKEDFASRWHLFEGVNASHNRISLTDSSLKNTLWIANRYNDKIYSYYVNIIGIPENGTLVITNPWTILHNGLNKIETNGIESETLGFRILEDSIKLDWSKLVIEQIPEHKGAFITDGVDDLIVSEKTMHEMLNGSEVTVVSMIHQIDGNPKYTNAYTNYIESLNGLNYIRNTVFDFKKTGIYGYKYSISTDLKKDINKVLGDYKDYETQVSVKGVNFLTSHFSVIGRYNNYYETSKAAWYWTFIANKVLTEDQINQVIEYFNLDKYVKPEVYYNVKKQGITNDNHAQFGDKLIDYSGNGRDMQLYNIVWAINSGIGDYPVSLATRVSVSSLVDESIFINQSYFKITNPIEKDSIDALEIQYTNYQTLIYTNAAINSEFKLRITSLPKNGKFRINPDNYGQNNVIVVEKDGIYNVAKFNGTFAIYRPDEIDYTGLKVELVPEHKDALVLDGVNDYGKVEELPILKDYTVVADREILNKDSGTVGSVLSKSQRHSTEGVEYGAFIFEMSVNNYSFNINPTNVGNNNYNKDRMFSYLTKYSYNGLKNVDVGTATDSNSMWLGTIRDNDNRFSNLAFYSAMCFPYSLSKFLIERQLKKHKAGTMYEDMVRFLPIINNTDYSNVEYYVKGSDTPIEIGNYIPTGYGFKILVRFKANIEIDRVIFENNNQRFFKTSITNEYVEYEITIDNVSNYPQKIDIVTYKVIDMFKVPIPFPIIVEYEDLNGVIYNIYSEYTINCTIPVKIHKVTNLLPELYRVDNYTLVYDNREIVFTSIDNIKDQWFKLDLINSFRANTTYLLDDNPPKCILSPSILKLSSYAYARMLYIPDISGHGNNGVFVNTSLDSELSGPQSDGTWKLDGVDDCIVINDLSIGGRQMFMKFSFGNIALAYDQRNGGINNFAMIVGNNGIAHNTLNSGDSYIDGIFNKNILSNQLQNVIHNVTLTNDIDIDVVSQTPVIGSNAMGTNDFTKMSLYTFMLFDEISSPEKIKELNEIIGVNPIVETPPYYYDAYGRSNLDENKVTIDNLGTGGVHPLVAQNIAFEAMSGYGGYTFPNFSRWSITGGNIGIDVDTETPYHIDITNMNESNQWNWCRHISEGQFTVGGSGKAIFKCDKNIGFIIDLKYRKAGDTVDNTAKFFEQQVKANTPTEITWTYKTQEELDALGAISHWYLVYFWLAKDVTYSIDMLPEYPNAIVLDGVDDSITNTTIPAMDDYTYILKRKNLLIKKDDVSLYKGTSLLGGGHEFVAEFIDSELKSYGFSFGNYVLNMAASKQKIIYGTKTSYNGINISPGTNNKETGLQIAKLVSAGYKNMVFYKMMLYPKTLNMLQINMLKNLFELDEKIDINNPIFKEPEQGGGVKNLKVQL